MYGTCVNIALNSYDFLSQYMRTWSVTLMDVINFAENNNEFCKLSNLNLKYLIL